MRNEIIYPFFTFYLGILRRPSYQVAIDWMIAEMDIRDAGGPDVNVCCHPHCHPGIACHNPPAPGGQLTPASVLTNEDRVWRQLTNEGRAD